ncbi:MAG: AtpZ/AtpI family protein [Armatimonadota bacterium]
MALIVAGFVLVALVVAGYAIGAALDRHYGTSPRWALVGLLIGFVIGFWDLYLLASRFLANQPNITT